MMQLNQIMKDSDYGLVINYRYHKQNKWVCAQTHYLIEALISEFDPIIITSQLMYEIHKHKLQFIISLEPGWGAPKIKYDRKQHHIIGIFVSDPHNKTDWLENYVNANNVSFVFSYYYHPFLHHFPSFDRDRLIHVPWAVPDEFVNIPPQITYNGQQKIQIFGASNGEAYDVRNWCRQFPFVDGHTNSGCENKVMSDRDYFLWLQQYDAIIAAGSLSKKYQLVTPKYFEIAAAGSLLFAQYCDDLELLGFNRENCIIFDQGSFETLAMDYLNNPEIYLDIRIRGNNLIRDKHKISDRIGQIKTLFSP